MEGALHGTVSTMPIQDSGTCSGIQIQAFSGIQIQAFQAFAGNTRARPPHSSVHET